METLVRGVGVGSKRLESRPTFPYLKSSRKCVYFLLRLSRCTDTILKQEEYQQKYIKK